MRCDWIPLRDDESAYPQPQFTACNFRALEAVRGPCCLRPPPRSAPIIRASSPPARSRPIRRRRRPPRPSPTLEARLSSYKPARKQGLLGRLFADKDAAAAARALRSRRGRPRQDHADGPVLSARSPVAHKRRAHFHEFMAEVHERIYGFRQNIARGEIADGDVIALTADVDLRRGLAAVLRRIPRHRHRRRDDPGTAVLETVRTRHRGGGDLERRARRSLQGRAEPRAVPAVHRADRGAHGRAAARCAHRFPAGKARRREDVAGAGGRCGRCRARQGLARR